ncbi:MAG: hypothetical protein ACLFVP_09050 [Candidatus Bathyarchaeia archaeon]
MKVFVEDIVAGVTEGGEGVVGLYGLDYSLAMYIPVYTSIRIAEAREPSIRSDPRKRITDLLADEIRRLGIEELYINDVNERGVYSGTLEAGEDSYEMVPSEGILLCSITGTPIYFKSELGDVKHSEEGKAEYL